MMKYALENAQKGSVVGISGKFEERDVLPNEHFKKEGEKKFPKLYTAEVKNMVVITNKCGAEYDFE